MPVEWTPHRFSGGVLALDVANTVVHRLDPEKRFDRFADAEEIGRFAQTVSALRPAEWGGRAFAVPDPVAVGPRVLALREATDALFRDACLSGGLHAPKLEALLRSAADGMAGSPERFGGPAPVDGKKPLAFEAALALSALALLRADAWRRIRVCPACAWLFLDASRNGSRRWCDMAVCGNRNKAHLHYRKKRQTAGGEHA